MKDIDADYYGYRDEDDGVLLPLEEAEDKKATVEAFNAWKQKREDRLKSGKDEEEEEEPNIYAVAKDVIKILKIIFLVLMQIDLQCFFLFLV